MCAARGLLPPGFRKPWRRAAATALVTAVLYVGVFAPLGLLGSGEAPPDLSRISTPQLFLLHAILVATLGAWFLLGFAAPPPLPVLRPAPEPPPAPAAGDLPTGAAEAPVEPAVGLDPPVVAPAAAPLPEAERGPEPVPAPRVPLGRVFAAQLGFRAPSVATELGVGIATGIGAWLAVIAALVAIAGVIYALGGERMLPQKPPALVPWIAALPFGVRLLVSLSAGVVEETFFRGFLQPRMGVLLSTGCFALAHASYGQPFMLVGVTLLSLAYAGLVAWRRNIWPAIAAHFLFDAIQLLVVIPAALRFVGK